MGLYQHVRKNIEESYKTRSQIYKNRLAQFNSEPSINRVDKPTNIARARTLGYKAKEGVVIIRVKVSGGSSKRKQPSGGRKPSKSGRFFNRVKSLQSIAEERANRKYMNCEVLNSYYVGNSGSSNFYEVIMIDRSSPSILADPIYAKMLNVKRRAFRGLTSSGKKHRGLIVK